MNTQQFEYYEQIFKALADKSRLQILSEINKSKDKTLCVCDLEEIMEMKQSKLSYHLKQLVQSNIVIVKKHGTWNYYSLNEEQIQLVLTKDTCCKIL